MSKFKMWLLMPVAAAALVACGGGETVLEDSADGKVIVSLPEPNDGETVSRKTAAWVALTDDASPVGKSLMQQGAFASLPNRKSANGISNSHLADGVLLNVDNPPEGWKESIKSALKSGQTVVLLASGDGQKLYDATLALTGIGVKANAAMVLSDANLASYSLLPFHASEVQELAEMMSYQFHRRSGDAS
jgi:hypothetical protein